MGILGYIVSKNKVTDVLPYIKVVPSFDKIEDKKLPILIIGLEEARKNASSFSILEKQLSENVFWTFGKREKRIDFERDLENFQNLIIKQVIKQIKYYYLNLFTLKQTKIKQLIQFINDNNEKYFFINKKMIYLYQNNYILGVSKEILSYLGISSQKIVRKIQKNTKNKVYFGDEQVNMKLKLFINNKQYLITYFLSLNNE